MESEELELRLLLEAIYLKYHYDFRGYSMASIKRRLLQARKYFDCRSFSALQDRVLHEPEVLPQLIGYMTVQVSEMFRDPSYFKVLREQVVPHLKTYPSLRVWVAGCADGEEVYSLAILFREEGLEKRTMFYGTDISGRALERAKAGVYEADRFAAFSENYQLAGGRGSFVDYYTAAYGNAVIDKSLRERVVFSDHSLVSDGVFAEVQLVCCRNVLIYFDRPLQDRAVGVFKDALVRRGFLGLGLKENLRFSEHAPEFEDFAPKERIYQRR